MKIFVAFSFQKFQITSQIFSLLKEDPHSCNQKLTPVYVCLVLMSTKVLIGNWKGTFHFQYQYQEVVQPVAGPEGEEMDVKLSKSLPVTFQRPMLSK